MKIRKDYYPDEIALALCNIADPDFDNTDKYGDINPQLMEIMDEVYSIMTTAENPYNSDSKRTLWDVLQNIAERFARKEI